MAKEVSGDMDYPKEISAGTGGKTGGFDDMIEERSKVTGAAKPAEDGKGLNYQNIPDGQKMVG